jgi:hypothetical protein
MHLGLTFLLLNGTKFVAQKLTKWNVLLILGTIMYVTEWPSRSLSSPPQVSRVVLQFSLLQEPLVSQDCSHVMVVLYKFVLSHLLPSSH